MKVLYIILFLFCNICNFISQTGFRSRYTAPNSVIGQSKATFETSPGTYFSAGIVYDTLSGNTVSRLAILGLNSSGQVQWLKKYGNKKFQYLNVPFISRSFIKQGNFVFHTCCVLDSNNKYSGVLIKFNLNGDTLWQKIYKHSNQDVIPQMLTASVDGGFLISGFFQDWINHVQPTLLIKTDVHGVELWRRTINNTGKNVLDGKSILQDSASKKILIVGYQYVGTQSSWNTYDNVLILDSLGNNAIHKYYNTGYLMDIIQTRDKKFIGVGATEFFNSTLGDYQYTSYMVKFDINNPSQAIWKNVIYDQTARVNTFSCAKELPNGEILIAGGIDSLKFSDTIENTNIRFIRINPSNGNVVWRKDYSYLMNSSNHYNDLSVSSLELTSDKGWITAINVINSLTKPLFYVKYDSTGCDTSAEWCKSVALGVSEFERSTGWHFDIYPNPSSKFISLSTEIPSSKKLYIEVNDLTGRLIEKFSMDSKSKELDVSAYKDGVYLINIMYEGRIIESKRLIVNKN